MNLLTGATIRCKPPLYLSNVTQNRGNLPLHRYIATLHRFHRALLRPAGPRDSSNRRGYRCNGSENLWTVATIATNGAK